MPRPSVVFHGHFYQPPREDPATDRVPREVSAAPFHDWNERILAECYRPVTEARILDGHGRIRDVLNTLEWMSWDAGPTLLRWLAREAPAVYARFLEADRRSRARTGFGNALAAPYHHVILPLASYRDKVTEVRWGIADFKRRFGRDPEGMWLPETAVDMETLEVLAREGITFTVLAPGQLVECPAGGMPGRVALGRGRSIAVFPYDGTLSHGVAFGSLLGSADAWIGAVKERADEQGKRLVSLAADGETFGHHHPWSDMALAATLAGLERAGAVRLESFASFLAHTPPVEDVVLVEPSSWSCAHGVDRWRADCGCKMAPHQPSQQRWRSVLREGLEALAADLHASFEEETRGVFDDPWAVRDAYGHVLDQGPDAARAFVRTHAQAAPDRGQHAADTEQHAADMERAAVWLEVERDALRMFTSCGWFFDDLAGLEPLQVLRYAAHALDLLGERGGAREQRLRSRLAEASSNDPAEGSGRDVWDRRIRGDASGAGVASEVNRGTDDGLLRGAAVRDAPVLSAVRRFLRAPGPDAAGEVARAARDVPDEGRPALLAAQSLFARGVPRGGSRTNAPVREAAHALGFSDAFFEPRDLGGVGPVGFVFGLHLHQPVGNFDEVFRSHTDDVYLPFLERLSERGVLPLTVHVSGPLLQWLERDGHRFLDTLGELAAAGSVEILLSGLYEPVLPALARDERVEQVRWMKEWVEGRFGVEASGLWLTERVWEPDLVEDLADAGVRYAFVDDRHFLVAGHQEATLHQPHWTEAGGKRMLLLPIDERLRYLVPFRPPSELERYFRALRAEDRPLAILADDGEKFGGWPGTAEWVWKSGWLESFLDTMTRLADEGVVRLMRGSDAVARVAATGPSYLPSASYREMEGWSLPPDAAVAHEKVEVEIENAGLSEAAGRFLRGGHWRNFMAIYPESDRMHRKAARLADLCRTRGAPAEVRHAVGRARCNDVYWHGVFGGLYLRHLREAVWANLAEAEAALREGEALQIEAVPSTNGGPPELWVHSAAFSATVELADAGAVTELTRFHERRNLVDVLTRRWESYHRSAPGDGHGASPGEHPVEGPDERHTDAGEPAATGGDTDGMPSIHALEETLAFDERPVYDAEPRVLLTARVLHADTTLAAYRDADYEAVRVWREAPRVFDWDVEGGAARIVLTFDGRGALRQETTFREDGTVDFAWTWDPSAFPAEAWFAPELSLSHEPPLEWAREPGRVWRYEVRTLSKSERGPEASVQGLSVTPMWPCAAGRAALRIGGGGGTD